MPPLFVQSNSSSLKETSIVQIMSKELKRFFFRGVGQPVAHDECFVDWQREDKPA